MISAFLTKCSCMIVFMIATSPKPVRHHLVRFRFVLIFVFYFHFCVFHCNFHFSSFLTNVSLFHITFFLGPALSATSCMSIFPSTSPITISSLYLNYCPLIPNRTKEYVCVTWFTKVENICVSVLPTTGQAKAAILFLLYLTVWEERHVLVCWTFYALAWNTWVRDNIWANPIFHSVSPFDMDHKITINKIFEASCQVTCWFRFRTSETENVVEKCLINIYGACGLWTLHIKTKKPSHNQTKCRFILTASNVGRTQKGLKKLVPCLYTFKPSFK